MAAQGFITEAQAEAASAPTVAVTAPAGERADGIRYFADWIADQVQSHLGYIDRDLLVKTTLDAPLHNAAHAALEARLAGQARMPEQAANVAVPPAGGGGELVRGGGTGGGPLNRGQQTHDPN